MRTVFLSAYAVIGSAFLAECLWSSSVSLTEKNVTIFFITRTHLILSQVCSIMVTKPSLPDRI